MTAEEIRIILVEVAAGRGGPPCRMRSDNGPEFVAEVVRLWLEETGSGSLTPIGESEPVTIVWREPPELSSILASPSEALFSSCFILCLVPSKAID